ncbi:MAG: type II toxin-antitoxin system HicB family antitoxin [Candidatus Binatus sp.]|uniref:type II toxin-antitoxin system HicB family antitoxin n=1 Tax=Candidatus Binatus sp. TaxID=2811406 RepID=UPI002728CE9E|nr:type II toxin-antitoxin system HicB family antitoxin [Candidatus Binatus sp.]MDO8432536.1 type II toxin-antitoxin system HicB family antitoxin [Candidatus Binatus sp.]
MKKSLLKKSRQQTASSAKNRPQDYLKLPYARILIPEEDGAFSAEVLEFPGCYSQGDNAGEAFENLEKAAVAWIEACQELGQEIPPPSSNQGYGGKIALRLPRGLHRLAAHKAERDRVSLNQCLVTAIAAWVGADNLYERITHKIEMNFVQMTNYVQITALWGPGNPSWGPVSPWIMNATNVTPNLASMYPAGLVPAVAPVEMPKKQWVTSGEING